MTYWEVFVQSTIDTAGWVYNSIIGQVPWYQNYFWGLILLSLLVWTLEICFPWRKNQAIFRKDFWLDACYMVFNFFIFSVIISGFYALIEYQMGLFGLGMSSLQLIQLEKLPMWSQLLIFFLVLDFVQWFTHVMLHRFEFLWRFHKVHHSVQEMGFAAHLRYHWMENVFYKPLKTIGVMLLGGFEPEMAFIVHFLSITIGHFNHANLKITWGPFKYIFNNPVMHLWHHAKELPQARSMGVNFGISLSVWDYIFNTKYIPDASGTIGLGFSEVDKFPTKFSEQFLYGFKAKSDKNSISQK